MFILLVFILTPLNVTEVHRALKQLDSDKSAGPDNLESYFLKSAASFMAEALRHIYVNNLCNNFSHAVFSFYADDTVIYCSFPSVVQALEFLQSVVDVVQ